MGEDLPGTGCAVPLVEGEHPLNQGDWQRLWLAAGHSPCPCRDRCLLHLFWHLGPTVSAAAALRLEQVDFLGGCLRAGGDEILLPPELLRAIATYVSIERPARSGPALFIGRHGRPLRPAAIHRVFHSMAAASGVAADPQRLRRQALVRQLLARPVATLRRLRPQTV